MSGFLRDNPAERIWEIRGAVKEGDTLTFYEGDARLTAVIDGEPAEHRPDAVTVEDQHGDIYAIYIPLANIVGHPDAHYIAKRRAPLAAGTKVKINGNWPTWEGYTGEVVLHDGGRFSVYIKLDDEPDDRLISFPDDRSLHYHIAADQRSVEVLS